MESVEKKIEQVIRRRPKGSIFFADDFSKYGSPEAIRKSLERLHNKAKITRLTHGIYTKPKESKYLGAVMPSAEEVAEAITKRDKIRTVPTGSYALNALGLSPQIPMKIVLLTDGSPRELKIGKRTINFKKSTPNNLLAKGKISRLVIQALKEIGKEKIDEREEKKIIELLKSENIQDLKHDIPLAPAWIRKIMNKAILND